MRVQLEEATGTVEAVRGRIATVRWDTGALSPVPLTWLSDAPGCAQCGAPMEAERSTRKYCGATCRKRAQRGHAKAGGGKDTGETSNVREGVSSGAKRAA